MRATPGAHEPRPPVDPSPPGPDGRPPAVARHEAPIAASGADDLGRLAEAGLTVCTLWLPVAAGHVDEAMEWVAAEGVPRLT